MLCCCYGEISVIQVLAICDRRIGGNPMAYLFALLLSMPDARPLSRFSRFRQKHHAISFESSLYSQSLYRC